MAKRKSIPKLKKELTKVFNRYVRFRDCPNGIGICISCQKPYPIEKMHAGHYLNSTYSAVRFDERNVNAQCGFNCNLNKSGNITEYRFGLIKKYGIKVVEDLEAMRHDEWKWNRLSLEGLIVEYKSKLRKYE